jgi:hypothetical protein
MNCKFFRSTSGQNDTHGRVWHEFCRPKPKLQKRIKHEFWVKWGGLGAFVSKKSTTSFFAPQVARTALRGRVLHEFCRPKPKLQKRIKHEFWVKRGGLGAFVSKKSNTSFFAPQVAITHSGVGFARVLSAETETAKMHQT